VIRFIVAALASINIAGFLGLGWFASKVVFHDGVMWVELAICAVPMAVLALTTIGGLALRRRSHSGAAIALLTVAALPTLAVFGFLLYLDRNPIDWR
jgi:hypothetical protein